MSKKHMGSSIDNFLKEEGIFEEAQAQAVKEAVAWQLAEAMKKNKISKNKLATLLKTSRTQVDRILDPKNDITLGSLQRAAAMVGRRVTIELVSGINRLGSRVEVKVRVRRRAERVEGSSARANSPSSQSQLGDNCLTVRDADPLAKIQSAK